MSPRTTVLVVAGALAGLAVIPATSSAAFIGFSADKGNIGCAMSTFGSSAEVRCDIRVRSWDPPPRPAACDDSFGDYGQGMFVTKRGTKGRYVCAGDTALGMTPTLRPGAVRRLAGFTCTVRAKSVRCRNAGGHGFEIGRNINRAF
jgi:hypothetical protein